MIRFLSKFPCHAAVVLALVTTAGPARALVIVPTYTPSVTPQMQSAVNYVINEYESFFSDPVTLSVSINVGTGGTGFSETLTPKLVPTSLQYGPLRTHSSRTQRRRPTHPLFPALARQTRPAGRRFRCLSPKRRHSACQRVEQPARSHL